MCTRHKWSESTLESIDWLSHGRAINRNTIPQAHCCKLIHDKLPTNSIVSKYDDHRRAHCPQCQHDSEDCDHILRCPHESRVAWRKTFLSNLRKRCDILDSRPYLQGILLDGIKTWFHQRDFDYTVYPSTYHRLCRDKYISPTLLRTSKNWMAPNV
jgi:hypothetical protein